MSKKRPPTEPTASGWNRDQLTVRLSGRRKELLKAIADREAPGCAPTEAIDRALDLALAAREARDGTEMIARIFAVEETMEAGEARRVAEAARVEVAIKALAQSMARLHALIAELTSE